MQRKDDILMMSNNSKTTLGSILNSREHFSSKKIPYVQAKRSGFAMIMAVIVMIVIATISMFTLMQTSHTVKRTADLYLYEQAELHTKSAIEYALFKIAKDGCYNNLNFTLDTLYNVDINMRYVYSNATTNVAATLNCAEFIGTPYVSTQEQNGSVLMDIVVDVNSTVTGSDVIRYTRRTIQKL